MTGASRAQLRAELVERIPRWYSPAFHLALPTAIALGAASVAFLLLRDLRAWQLGAVPLFLVVANAAEWHAHRGLLHRRVRFLETLYLRHTPMHHAVFVAEDMAIRDPRELKLVLMPAVAFPALLVATSPVALALVWAGQRNLALLGVISSVLYLLAYEWLHLAYHLPETSRVGRSRALAILRRHHQRHHAPALMGRWNFNVTVPLWDAVRGTIWRPESAVVRPSRA